MSLIRWNQDRGRAFLAKDVERFFNGWGFDPEVFDSVWYPTVDVSESEQVYEVKAELPGINKDNIKVSLEDNVLTLKGERKEEAETKKKNVQIHERYYGKFQRSFRLPVEVKSAEIKASYKDGVLKIEIPKAEEARPKEIAIA